MQPVLGYRNDRFSEISFYITLDLVTSALIYIVSYGEADLPRVNSRCGCWGR